MSGDNLLLFCIVVVAFIVGYSVVSFIAKRLKFHKPDQSADANSQSAGASSNRKTSTNGQSQAEARQILLRAFKEQGPLLFSNRSCCLGFLKDYGGNDHPEILLLVDCVELGIVNRLASTAAAKFDEKVIAAIAVDIHAKRRYSIELCRWAVESWAIALGLKAPSAS